MNLALELKKKKNEILQVQAAKSNQEVRIEELLDQIERIRDSIKVSDSRIIELGKEVEALEARLKEEQK